MATKKVEVPETKEIVKPDVNALVSRPSFLKTTGETKGLEDIEQTDLLMPRLQIAQKMSPQIDKNAPEYIEGLEEGDFFNSLTKENYGPGPLNIVPLWAFKSRLLFRDKAEGGGIECSSANSIDGGTISPLCETCPRNMWDGNKRPDCNLIYNYVILFADTREMIAISLRSANIKIAKKFNSLMRMRNAEAVYAGIYTVTSLRTKNEKGVFYVADFANCVTPWVNEEMFNYCGMLFDSIRSKQLEVAEKIHKEQAPKEDADGEPVPF